ERLTQRCGQPIECRAEHEVELTGYTPVILDAVDSVDTAERNRQASHTLHVIKTEIAGDPEQPRPEPVVITTLGQAVVRTHERVLHEIERSVVIESHAAHVTVDHVLMTTHQLGIRVPITAQHVPHEVRIGHGLVASHRRAHCTTSTAT